MKRKASVLSLLVLLSAPTCLAFTTMDAMENLFGLRLTAGMFQPTNAPESYEKVYDGPGFDLGLGGFWLHESGWSIVVHFEYFLNSGERAYASGGGSGYDEDLGMWSLLATGYYHFLRDGSISPFLGGGLGYYNLTVDATGIDESVSSSSWGAHLDAGIDFLVGTPVNIGLEARYSIIPDLIGDGGLSAYYDEHDFGGVALFVTLSVFLGGM